MDTIIYLLLSLTYLGLLIIGLRSANHHGWLKMSNVLFIVILALLYDNGILALGKWIGEGKLLEVLNKARYWMHALFTPLLVLFAWNTLIRAQIAWAKKPIIQGLIGLLTLGLILFEMGSVTLGLSMEPSWKYGVLSYKNVGGHHGPPVMITGVSLMLLVTSIVIWWKQKWPWYFLGILFMGLPAMGHLFLKSNAFHNISELILIIGLLATKLHQDKMGPSRSG